MKLLLIASVGFFIDAYDLFNINLVVIILNYVVNGKLSGTIANAPLEGGLLKASANIGNIVGQIGFGFLGDVFGRKGIYGIEMCIAFVATVLIIAVPLNLHKGVFTYITIFRVLMGIGIGGDYPMSASVVADRAGVKRRGTMISFIFAMQGWGSFIGALVFIILMAIYKKGADTHDHTGQFNSLWRLYTGVILVPSAIVIFLRFRLPESTRMKEVQALRADPNKFSEDEKQIFTELSEEDVAANAKAGRSQAWADFREYFSEWRHLKILIGTTVSWFLLDLIFYGISLNQSLFIAALDDSSSKIPWEFLWQQGVANIVIAIGGFLPGYYFTFFLVEYIGRKPIQLLGFSMNFIIFCVMAGKYHTLQTHHNATIACFIFLQFFFNFGANSTTFIIPAEVFPTRVRGFSHGLSAACGKCGAIIASLAVSIMSTNVGPQNVLWLFAGVSAIAMPFVFLIPETKGRDADKIDFEERQAAYNLKNGISGNLKTVDSAEHSDLKGSELKVNAAN